MTSVWHWRWLRCASCGSCMLDPEPSAALVRRFAQETRARTASLPAAHSTRTLRWRGRFDSTG